MLYGGSEAIYGNVKHIFTIRTVKFGNSPIKRTPLKDDVGYDKKGDILKKDLDVLFINLSCIYSKYFDKYDWIKKVNYGSGFLAIQKLVAYNSDSILVKLFDYNAEQLGMKRVACRFRDDSTAYTFNSKYHYVERMEFPQDKYNPGLKEIYKYNDKILLTAIEDYSVTNKPTERILFAYQAFDRYGNWTKRTETRKNAKGIVTGMVTTTRQITYY